MAALNFLSLEQFEAKYGGEKPHYEYWFGEAIQKSMPTSLHGILQWVIASLLAQAGWKPAVEVRLKVSSAAWPIPDVVADRTAVLNPYPTEPFELCVEILSPSDDLRRITEKAAHYIDWGIRSVWIVDPDLLRVYVMTTAHPVPVELSGDQVLTLGSEQQPIVSVAALFAEAEQYVR